MPLDRGFFEAAEPLFDEGMGTENVGPLLYALAKMRRPKRVLAVGLGYTTLFLLKALCDSDVEAAYDRSILAGDINNVKRRSVLSHERPNDSKPLLIGIDDFSDDNGRLASLDDSVERIGASEYFELRRERYQEFHNDQSLGFGLVWIDCGHQTDYAYLCNKFWPLVEGDGGLFAMHYTHVDIEVPQENGASCQLMVPGPWANAAKKQLIGLGPNSDAELLSIVEPHKARQGSITLMRKLDVEDRCRDTTLLDETLAMYGVPGASLLPLCTGQEYGE